MRDLHSAEQASYWLSSRLKKLEAAVPQGPNVLRLLSEGPRDVLVDLEADPVLFHRDAADRLRRYTGRVREATLEELRRQGVQSSAVDQAWTDLLGQSLERAVEVTQGMMVALRQRIEELGAEGTQGYDAGTEAYEKANRDLGQALHAARAQWEATGPGRLRRSRLPWRRRRGAKLDPTTDPTFRLDAAASAQRLSPALRAALTAAGQGAVLLTVSKYFADLVNHFSELQRSAYDLGDRARLAEATAERRLFEVRRSARSRSGPNASLLCDDASLDAVLDRLHIDTPTFFARGHVGPTDLAALDLGDLERVVREWVESELAHIRTPTLAEALSGMTNEHGVLTARLTDLLRKGQPLMAYDDDLPVRFDEGQRAQTFAAAVCDDMDLRHALDDACDQLGFPSPLIERGHEDDLPSLRIMLFVAGLPWFAQAERLREMIATHQQVFDAAANPGDARLAGWGMALDDDVRHGLRDAAPGVVLPELMPPELVVGMPEVEPSGGRDSLDDEELDDDEDVDDDEVEVRPHPLLKKRAHNDDDVVGKSRK